LPLYGFNKQGGLHDLRAAVAFKSDATVRSGLEGEGKARRRVKAAMKPHVMALIQAGVSVVLDFPANTRGQRRWFREIIEATGVAHVLHVLDVSDEVCLARLRARNTLGDHPFVVTDALFHEMTGYFTEPEVDEGFTILRHSNEAEIPEAPAP
jgi:predicted kinase